MRVVFDITHPADVHLFRPVIARLQADGDEVLVASRDKDVTVRLLDGLGIEHVCLGRMGRGLAGLAGELLVRCGRLLRVSRRFRPDVLAARVGVSIGPVGAALGVPRVVVEDTEHARLQLALGIPFATVVCTGLGYRRDWGRRQVRFRGLPMLCYLTPSRFQPDPEVLRRAGLDPAQRHILLRRVAWRAAHDRGLRGASDGQLARAAERLARFGRVLISSESPLPASLAGLACPVPAHELLHLQALAELVIGEGAQMAGEAAVLGTPAVYCSRLRLGYLLALERDYRLVRNTASLAAGLAVAERLLARDDLADLWQQRRRRLLADCEDVCEFLLRTIRRAARPRRLASPLSLSGRGPG